jgi:hypothetical protein
MLTPRAHSKTFGLKNFFELKLSAESPSILARLPAGSSKLQPRKEAPKKQKVLGFSFLK